MRKRWLWLGLVAVLLLGGAVLAALLEPTRVVRGLLAGEPFYRGRPLSYWREVLRDGGRNGNIPDSTVGEFYDAHAAFPVLRGCARDPDRNVRWPAIALLSRGGVRSQQVLDVLLAALEDDDVEVRLKAVGALARWGPMARPALPALTARLQDPELQVAHYADLALWEIDVPAAVEACGWRPFACEEWGFLVALPGEPERSQKPVAEGTFVVHDYSAWHQVGPNRAPTRYTVAVTEYPPDFLAGTTEEQWLNSTRDLMPVFLGWKVVSEKPIEQSGHKGRERVVEAEGLGFVRSRLFWVGRRLYQVQVAYQERFLNEPAADYFLDSFRLGPPEQPSSP
jgi:HEAT repeats